MSELVCRTLELLAENKDGFVSAVKNIFNTKTMATLKISDLSVGDWVNLRLWKCDYDDPETLDAKVLSIEGNSVGVGYDNSGIVMSAFVEDLQPIPITAEILEANGWFRLELQCVLNIEDNRGTSHDGEYVIMWYADDEYLTISWGGREDEVLVERTMMECRVKYIHELQHALRLAGVEKEINL